MSQRLYQFILVFYAASFCYFQFILRHLIQKAINLITTVPVDVVDVNVVDGVVVVAILEAKTNLSSPRRLYYRRCWLSNDLDIDFKLSYYHSLVAA